MDLACSSAGAKRGNQDPDPCSRIFNLWLHLHLGLHAQFCAEGELVSGLHPTLRVPWQQLSAGYIKTGPRAESTRPDHLLVIQGLDMNGWDRWHTTNPCKGVVAQ